MIKVLFDIWNNTSRFRMQRRRLPVLPCSRSCTDSIWLRYWLLTIDFEFFLQQSAETGFIMHKFILLVSTFDFYEKLSCRRLFEFDMYVKHVSLRWSLPSVSSPRHSCPSRVSEYRYIDFISFYKLGSSMFHNIYLFWNCLTEIMSDSSCWLLWKYCSHLNSSIYRFRVILVRTHT